MCSKCGFDGGSICEFRNVEIKCNHEALSDSPVSQQRKLHFYARASSSKMERILYWSRRSCTGLVRGEGEGKLVLLNPKSNLSVRSTNLGRLGEEWGVFWYCQIQSQSCLWEVPTGWDVMILSNLQWKLSMASSNFGSWAVLNLSWTTLTLYLNAQKISMSHCQGILNSIPELSRLLTESVLIHPVGCSRMNQTKLET